MVSSDFVPWYNRPARPFPARVWLEGYYPFSVSPSVFASPTRRPPGIPSSERRPFPALAWWEKQQASTHKLG